MKHAHFVLALTCLAAEIVACSSAREKAREPDSTSSAETAATAAPSAGAVEASAGPAAPAEAVAPGVSSGTLTIGGKAMPLTKFELQQDGGENYFYAKAENGEGVGLMLGKELAEGTKIAKDRGVIGHILEGGKILNVGDGSKMTFEVTKLSIGTWEKQGKCSGRFTAETTYKSTVIKASGTFEGAPCYKL